ncbi:MAG: leucine-rich repeat protein [Clostridia bacterium]|nr:leucine-rich repeat protein [Clostridia bacterium]
MKRLFTLILALVMLLGSLEASFAQEITYPCDGYTTKNSVIIRKAASTKAKQVGKVSKKGTKLTVHASAKSGKVTWYQITTAEGKDGFIRGDLLRLEARQAESPAQQEPEPQVISAPVTGERVTVTESVFKKVNPGYELEHQYDQTGFVGLSYGHLVSQAHSYKVKFSGETARFTLAYYDNQKGGITKTPTQVDEGVNDFIAAYLKAAGCELPPEGISYFPGAYFPSDGLLRCYNGYQFKFTYKKAAGYYKVIPGAGVSTLQMDEFILEASKVKAPQIKYLQDSDGKLRLCLETTTGEDETLVMPSYNGDAPIDRLTIPPYDVYDTAVKTIVLGARMQEIENIQYAGDKLPNLEKYMVDAANPYLATIDGCVYDKQNRMLVACPPNKRELVIPEGIVGIKDYACANTKLVSVSLPASCTQIGQYAFSGCEKLEQVTFAPGAQVTLIDDKAFENCTALTAIHIPGDAPCLIDRMAFTGCAALKAVTLPKGLTTLGFKTFYDCDLKEITLPAHVEKLEYNSFSPHTLVTVEANGRCREVDNGIFTPAGEWVFYPFEAAGGNEYEVPEGTTAILCPVYDAFKEIVIPASVTRIENFMVSADTKLVVPSGSYGESFAIQNNRLYESRFVESTDLSWLNGPSQPEPTAQPEQAWYAPAATDAPAANHGTQTQAEDEELIFGSYEQDGDTANGPEPIRWKVLARENGRALVISCDGLAIRAYHAEDKKITWEKCDLRAWLNGEFLRTAFTVQEQALIPAVTVSAQIGPFYNTDAGNATLDRVFLLSHEEILRCFPTDEARRCMPSDYLKTLVDFGTNPCMWWLRSPGPDNEFAVLVDSDGTCTHGDFGYVSCEMVIRPALWVDTAQLP